MKRILAWLTVLAMLLCCVPALAETSTGVGTAQGYGGEVTVALEVTDNVLTNVIIYGPKESEGVGAAALPLMAQAMLAANSIDVDVNTQATRTKDGVRAAAALALAAAGVDPANLKKVEAAPKAQDATYSADVVIVGAGGAGMTAALTAAEEGAKVIIVESQAVVGGNSVRATGGMNAAETAAQNTNTFSEAAGVEKTLTTAQTTYADNPAIKKLADEVTIQWQSYQKNPNGYFDSEELMALDTMIGGKGINDPALVEELVDESEDGIEWLKTIGINLTSVGSFGGASVKRIHRPVNAEGKTISVGAYMVPLLEKACNAQPNVTILLNTTANEILTKGGAACGIKATGKDGETVTVNAKAVILATGGFGANLDMVAQYNPALKGFMTTNAAGAQGQGLKMAEALGAAMVDLEQIQIHPTVQADTAALITEGLRGDGAILVNAEGKRFTDEVGTRDAVSAAEIAQTGSYSWLIVDQAMLDKSSVIAGYVSKGFTYQGATYEELAAAIGVDGATFKATMEGWNNCVANRNDPEFGRVSFANPLNTAPYYAIKVTAGIHHTMGGLKINTDTQVIGTNGRVIPGLYAAGEVTGGIHGANRLGGNAVADFVVFGRIAGEEAAEFALGDDD